MVENATFTTADSQSATSDRSRRNVVGLGTGPPRFVPGGAIFPMNLPSAMVTKIQGDWISELGLSPSKAFWRRSRDVSFTLVRNARDLELQLYELKKLRYQVWEAELSARKSRRTDNGIRERLGKGQGRAAR
jgi:hypothetical protein